MITASVMERRLRVGELADAVGVTADTIRYYERPGLLPAPGRTASGYRAYDAGAVDRRRFIQGAQRLGLRLGDIRDLLAVRDTGTCPCEPAEDLLIRRMAEVDAAQSWSGYGPAMSSSGKACCLTWSSPLPCWPLPGGATSPVVTPPSGPVRHSASTRQSGECRSGRGWAGVTPRPAVPAPVEDSTRAGRNQRERTRNDRRGGPGVAGRRAEGNSAIPCDRGRDVDAGAKQLTATTLTRRGPALDGRVTSTPLRRDGGSVAAAIVVVEQERAPLG